MTQEERSNGTASDAILREAYRRANAFISLEGVSHYMRAYDCGSALDPLFKWSLARTPSPREFILLQDWYLEEAKGEESGTVDENVDYVDDCFNCDPGHKQPTFSALFHTPWSKTLIERGSYLILNAALGIEEAVSLQKFGGNIAQQGSCSGARSLAVAGDGTQAATHLSGWCLGAKWQ